jgi:rod shape-determining protein MreC
VGEVVLGTDKRLRVRMSADYGRLEFLRVLRSHQLDPITDVGALVAPPVVFPAPDPVTDTNPQEAGSPAGTTDATEGDPGEAEPAPGAGAPSD